MRNRHFFLGIFTILLPITTLAQTTTEVEELNKIFKSFNQGADAPGGVITIGKDKNIFFNKATGMANLEFEISNTTETIFEAGSVSKQFTSTAILFLIAENKLSLEDDIRKYIPEIPDYGSPIKVKHLLIHTSGLKDWGSIFGITGWPRGTRAYSQNDARAMIFRQKTLNFMPGEEYSYSNSNFTLLATLVERITNTSLSEFTKQKIFIPAEMTHTQWRDNYTTIVKNRAVGYEKKKDTYYQDMPFENTYGHGALLTTTADMQKWLSYWNDNKFGKQLSTLRTTQGVLNNGTVIAYALGGVSVKKFNGLTEISHSGQTAGYRGWMAYYPGKNITVTCLSNGITIPSVAIRNVFLGRGAKGSPLAQKIFDGLPGFYLSEKGYNMIEVIQKNNKLYFKTGAEVLTFNKDTLTTDDRKIVPANNFKQFVSIMGTDTLNFIKIDKGASKPTNLNLFTGKYYSEECDTYFEIKVSNNSLYVCRNAEAAILLRHIYNNIYNMGGIILDFSSSNNQTYDKFTANVTRAQNIVFKKIM